MPNPLLISTPFCIYNCSSAIQRVVPHSQAFTRQIKHLLPTSR
jgi:hypothetical protein